MPRKLGSKTKATNVNASGNPKGVGQKQSSKKALADAKKACQSIDGMSPHEWLLNVANGHPVAQKRLVIVYSKTEKDSTGKPKELRREYIDEMYYATFPERVDCAKAAAPFYAPKLAQKLVKVPGQASDGEDIAKALNNIADKLPV